MNWTRSEDLKAQVRRRWDRGSILRARLTGESLFPMNLRLRRPKRSEVTDRFADVRRWIAELTQGAADLGYELEWEQAALRVHGLNEIPKRVTVKTESDALQMIRKASAADRFSALATPTLARFHSLEPWLTKNPHAVLEYEAVWERILAVLDFFARNPRPGCYRRQIDLPGVDTKFIENHRVLLGPLLDLVLPSDAVDTEASHRRFFDRRYGLCEDPPRVRFRALDSRLAIGGLTDLSLTSTDFAGLDLPCRRVFVTENKVNGLAFPPVPDAIVIFGLGYGLERLAEATWLRERQIFYWGDIDTHGFAILDRFRQKFPACTSILMDRDTLLRHRVHWGEEEAQKRHSAPLDALTPEEAGVYHDLLGDVVGRCVRLEQERIPFSWVVRAVEEAMRVDAGPIRRPTRDTPARPG